MTNLSIVIPTDITEIQLMLCKLHLTPFYASHGPYLHALRVNDNEILQAISASNPGVQQLSNSLQHSARTPMIYLNSDAALIL